MLETILSVLQVVAVGRRDLPGALHSGKDAGLSGAFGVGTGSGPFGGGSLVEQFFFFLRAFRSVTYCLDGRPIVQQGKPSRTSLNAAVRRAIHQLVDEPTILTDPVGVRLVEAAAPGAIEAGQKTFSPRS